MIVYSCKEHSEEALEETLEDNGVAPHFEKIEKPKQSSERCFICSQPAHYKISREENENEIKRMNDK